MTPALAVLAVVNGGALLVLLRTAAKLLAALSGLPVGNAPVGSCSCGARVEALEREMRDLADVVHRLPARWEDIKREANRLDSRARAVARSIRKELAASGAADERAEALADELGEFDGDGGEQGELLAVRESLAPVPEPPSRVDEWERIALARKFAS